MTAQGWANFDRFRVFVDIHVSPPEGSTKQDKTWPFFGQGFACAPRANPLSFTDPREV